MEAIHIFRQFYHRRNDEKVVEQDHIYSCESIVLLSCYEMSKLKCLFSFYVNVSFVMKFYDVKNVIYFTLVLDIRLGKFFRLIRMFFKKKSYKTKNKMFLKDSLK